jgi:hypothetical protein
MRKTEGARLNRHLLGGRAPAKRPGIQMMAVASRIMIVAGEQFELVLEVFSLVNIGIHPV